jgi:putative Ca2+/H+ antiporter (TMEM165/GDT1 family)
MALTVVPNVSPVFVAFALGLAVMAGLAVLVAHLAAPKVKRLIGAAILAVLVASVGVRAEDFVMRNPCHDLNLNDPYYWLLGCFWP